MDGASSEHAPRKLDIVYSGTFDAILFAVNADSETVGVAKTACAVAN
jgi:hypothetical protein